MRILPADCCLSLELFSSALRTKSGQRLVRDTVPLQSPPAEIINVTMSCLACWTIVSVSVFAGLLPCYSLIIKLDAIQFFKGTMKIIHGSLGRVDLLK